MEYSKSNEEVLSEIYRNAQLALTSISDILPEVENEEIKQEILRQHEEYERVSSKACLLAKEKGQELKEPGAIKKAMMWTGIKMNAMKDGGKQHIAEMMIQGTVMGITALKQSKTDSQGLLSPEVDSLLNELISLEEGFEEKYKEFL